MTLKAIIFDCDGTLLDTESCAYEAFCELYTEYGHVLPLDLWAQCVGTLNGPFDPYAHLSELTGLELERENLQIKFEAAHQEKLESIKLRPGVLEALEAARRMGLRIGLASSSDRAWIESHLSTQGIRHYFEIIRSSDDVEFVKPDPALYLLAAEGLGVRPEESVAIEDSRNGMLAAVRAGMRTIVIPNEVTKGLDFSEADIVIPTLEGRSLELLLADLLANASR